MNKEDIDFLISIQSLPDENFQIAYLERELEKKENIIKEVREYIETNKENTTQTLRFDENKSYNTALLELLEILDKGE